VIRHLVIVLAVMGVVAALGGSAVAGTGQRVDLKVLLLSADGTEPSYAAWKVALEREGVPFDVFVATEAPPLTAEALAEGATRARYQAVIVATGELVLYDGAGYRSALSPAEWAVLSDFERTFGIRRLSAFVYPSPRYGLNSPTFAGDMAGVEASLTPGGEAVFPYLAGPVPIDRFSYGYRATPLAGAPFATLVRGPDDSALAGIYTHADGREELVVTVDANWTQLQAQLLRHGLLGWVTRGVYLGYERNYLEAHVDDVFVDNSRWDTSTNTTPEPSPNPIRMTPADVARAVEWTEATGIRLDMVFNAYGASLSDPLTLALLAQANRFRWINHTWSHPNLDGADAATIADEITRNIDWATGKLPIDPTELVTGEHSGLANPALPDVLAKTGIRWIAADNSRQPAQYAIGPALTVPRHPTGVYFNVGTRAEQLDEYNHIYLPPPHGICQSSPTNTCFSQPATWAEYVDSEARIIFRHVVGNDPRAHYFHQANLAEDGLLYSVVDEVLRRYRALFRPPLLQLTHAEVGTELARWQRWREALSAGEVSAYLLDGELVVQTKSTVEVPLTGTSVGTEYGGRRSGWITVAPDPGPTPAPPAAETPPSAGSPNGAPVGQAPVGPAPGSGSVNEGSAVVAAPETAQSADGADGGGVGPEAVAAPANDLAPGIEGQAREGRTLLADRGRWSGAEPVIFAFRWERCGSRGAACRAIVGATRQTYRLARGDVGWRIRAVVSASNAGGSSSVSTGATAFVAPAAPRNLSRPAMLRSGDSLRASPGRWRGAGPLRYGYQWLRCTASGEACSSIRGATERRYRLTARDVGMRIAIRVRASNAGGASRAPLTFGRGRIASLGR